MAPMLEKLVQTDESNTDDANLPNNDQPFNKNFPPYNWVNK